LIPGLVGKDLHIMAKIGNEARLILKLAESKTFDYLTGKVVTEHTAHSPCSEEHRKGVAIGIQIYRDVLNEIITELERKG